MGISWRDLGIGFREWVKNPGARTRVAKHFAARAAVEVPPDLSQRQIRKLVRQLLSEQPKDPFYQDRIELLGDRATPHLLELLRDPRLREICFRQESGYIDDSPFERVCGFLSTSAPAAAVDLLLPFVTHREDHFRKEAALLLGNIGTVACSAPVARLLADENDYVRCYAMMGIDRGMEAGRCERAFLLAQFPALVSLIDREDRSVNGSAPRLLLAIDCEKACEVLLSDRYFHLGNDKLADTLRALNHAEVPIGLAKLLPLLEQLASRDAKHRYQRMLVNGFESYARNPDANAERFFRDWLEKGDGDIREGAARALCILAGIGDPRGFVWDRMKANGVESLSEPQRWVLALSVYDAEVCNGGHAQYFTNSSGDSAIAALAGLRAIGALGLAENLEKACALFARGAPADRDERWDEVGQFTPERDAVLGECDRRYYREKRDKVDTLICLYALENPRHFKD